MEKTLKNKIIDAYDSLSSQEKKVGKYIVDHYDEILTLSNGDLARITGVSDATVVRFAKSLGHKGFLTLKNELKQENRIVESLSDKNSKSYGLLNEIAIKGYYTKVEKDVKNFFENMNMDMIDRLCRNIIEAQTVYIYGIGSDKTIVEFLCNYLPLMGIRTVKVCEEGLSMKDKLISLSSNDFVIASCYPRLQDSDIWLADYIRETGAGIFLITDSDITAKALGVTCDYIKTKSSVDTFFNSAILSMYFCDVLLMKLREMNPDKVSEYLRKYDSLTGQL